MRLVAFSDTHGQHEEVTIPECDVVVFAGDACRYGSRDEFIEFVNWYVKIPAVRILVPGNHDFCTQKYLGFGKEACLNRGIFYLADDFVTINGITFYGFPWTPPYGNFAWMADEAEMYDKLKKISVDVDVMISHGPPAGILDRSRKTREFTGSSAIYRFITEEYNWPNKRDRDVSLHIFGHIHENYGRNRSNGCLFLNSSVLNLDYEMANKPHVINMEMLPSWRSA
jgi:Icc-related predicted phosphoesterase